MDENLHKDNLEEFFKNSFNDENIDPSGDLWDVPSEEVWVGIDANINPIAPPASGSFFNLKWMFAVAASVLIIGLVCYNLSLQKKVNTLTEVVENQSNTIEKLEKITIEKEIDDRLKSDLNKTNSASQSNNIESLSTLPSNNNSTSNSNQVFSQKEEKIVSNQSTSQEKNTVQNNKRIDDSVNESQFLNNKKQNPEFQQNNEIANGQIENNNVEYVVDEGGNPIQENNLIDDSNSSELPKTSIAVFSPLVTKTIFAEANHSINDSELELLPIAEEDLLPSVASVTRKGFYIGTHIAPTYGYRNIKSVNGPVLRRLLNEKEKAVYSVSLGLKAGYQFSKNWSVETGLNYYKNSIDSRHVAQVQYESQIERLNSDGDFDSNYQLKLATSYGEIETDIALTRNSDTQIDQNDYINLVLRTRQELKNISVPLAIRYRTSGQKLHFSAKAGISTNFIIQKDARIRATAVNRNGVQHRRTLVDKQFNGLKNTTFDVLFGIGLDYDLSKNLSLYFEPTATHSINPVYSLNGKIKTYPIVAALNIGAAYRF